MKKFLFAIILLFRIFSDSRLFKSLLTTLHSKLDSEVDEQLYSRQIFVYGKSSQQRLLQSHIVIYGSGLLAAEILKNLAMAGIGKISIIESSNEYFGSQSSILQGNNGDLVKYGKSLNSQIQVNRLHSIDDALNHDAITTIVHVDCSVADMIRLNQIAHSKGIKYISATVKGVCGMVFDDLINHEVTDTEGDAKKEIPIQMITRISNQFNQLKIVCIDEERFTDLGVSDTADIKISEEAHNISTYTLIVKDVLNPKTLIVEAACSHELQVIEEFFSKKFVTATLRKKVQTASLNHLPLNTIMNDVNEYIIPLNGCLSPKKDKAITLTVLGCILAIESKNINNNHINDEISFKDQETDKEEGFSLPIFRSEVINQLSRMGIEKPLKPVKQGGMIGLEAIDNIVERFYLSSKHQGICPATVSVIGSLAVQEAIKSVTHIHYPISQLFLFECLDSLHYQVTDNESTESDDGLQDHETETVLVSSKSKKKSMKKQNHLKSFDALINAEKVYGSEVIQELKQMKLFIVGAGAIGCELLKTLAMLGVGCGDENVISNEEVSDIDNKWKSIENGGIIITDMDTVERSNLNRQLLYREKHIGLSKSLVSSEMIKEINPSMKIIALTNKVSPDTENLFNSEFWSNVDVVLPALDNIDARLYVDSQCVRYYKWMIDSGTLGTRGSTQVVVPGFSESYASSADPPEEAIPLCTLKSFPYQPEHCIAWARALFDRVFNEEVRQLQSILQLAYQTNLSDGKNYDSNVDDLLKNLTPEGLESLNENLISFPCTPSSAIDWAIRLFHTLFMVEVKNLLQEHPPDDIDEEGAPFWGGSRRLPQPLNFDPMNPKHREFIVLAANLRLNVFGFNTSNELLSHLYESRTHNRLSTPSPKSLNRESNIEEFHKIGSKLLRRGPTLISSFQSHMTIDNELNKSEKIGDVSVAQVKINLFELLKNENKVFPENLAPEEFEKDDASLGHVDFITSAANLRCMIYNIQEIDRLEAQRVSGKIIPALATTTSLVAGLTCLELLKIASERIRSRKQILHNTKKNKDLTPFGIFEKYLENLKQTFHPNSNKNNLFKESVKVNLREIERDRVLGRFRNSFVNIARPLLTFSQPIAAEYYTVGDQSFNMWDTIEIPNMTAETLTISYLESYIDSKFQAKLQSVTYGDILLYGSYLADADYLEDLTIAQLIARSQQVPSNGNNPEEDLDGEYEPNDFEDVDENDGNKSETEETSEKIASKLSALSSKDFVDIQVMCTNMDDEDIRLPPFHIRCGSFEHEDENDDWSQMFSSGIDWEKMVSYLSRAAQKWISLS